MNTVTATTIPGDALRDSRHAWRREMFRSQEPASGPAPRAADVGPASTFAERARRVEVPGLAPKTPAADDAPSFAQQMRRVVIARPSEATANAAEDPRGAARTAAEQMVSSLFVQPLLDMALNSDADGPFSPGQAEKTFGPLLHQRLADEIVHKSDLPLVNAIVERMVADQKPGTLTRTRTRDQVAAEPRDG